MRPLMLGAATLLITALPPSAHAESKQLPIIDGAVAGAGQFYGTVGFLDFDGAAFCTGTLVAPTVVVTASHCFVEQDPNTDQITAVTAPEEVFVVAAQVNAEQVPQAQQYSARKIVLHAGYPGSSAPMADNGLSRQDDIALVLLTDAVTEVDVIPIPSLAEAVATLQGAPPVIITGYGLTDPNAQQAGVLNIATTVLGEVADYELVVGAPGNPDSCKGDSGGPAYIDSGGTVALYGASSRAVENSSLLCGDGGIYTFVPAYRSWIAANSEGEYTEPSGPIGGGVDTTGAGEGDDGCAAANPPSPIPLAGLLLLFLLVLAGRRREG